MVVYALAYVDVSKTQRATLRVGARGAYSVWLDSDHLIDVTSERAGQLDADAYEVTLKKGRHTLLFKVATENRGKMSLAVRFTSLDGKPLLITSLDPVTLKKGTRLAKPPRAAASSGDTGPALVAATYAKTKTSPEVRARAFVNAAIITKQLQPLDPTTYWRDLVKDGLGAGASSPGLLSDAASTLNNHWERMPLLTNAMNLSQQLGVIDPWLITQVVREINMGIGVGNIPARLNLLNAATVAGDSLGKANGARAVTPRLLTALTLIKHGQAQLAAETLEPLLELYPRNLNLLRVHYRINQSLNLQLAAQQTNQRIMALQMASAGITTRRIKTLMRGGSPDRALKLIKDTRRLNPNSLSLVVLESRALQQLGRSDGAIALLNNNLKRSPRNTLLLKEKGELFEQLGRTDDATKAYELALRGQPENSSLMERVQALKPRFSSYETPYRWGRDKMTPKPDAAQKHLGQDFYFMAKQRVVQVAPSGQSNTFHQEIVHVLTDEGARNWSSERLYYSPGEERVEVVSVRVLKADGSLSEAYTRRDFNALEGPGNLYYRRQYAYIDVGTIEPGDVVEYAWRVLKDGTENYREGYFGDIWYFESNVDIEHARYVLLSPEEMVIHTREPKLKSFRSSTMKTTVQELPYVARVMEATEVSRVKTDPGQPGRSEIFDYVLVSTYKNWDDVGKWWWNLIKDQLVTDANIRKVVADVTGGLTDDLDKVRAIHKWVVKNTRYVGIEFGVHGWKPYRTTLAMQRRFGDCKDKASLTKVMLEAAGIEANMVLIRTRRLGAVASEPANLAIFDHAISYVPKYKLFLDGTAEFSGTQNLPTGDQGSLAVIVKDGGGVEVVTTPVDRPGDNKYIRVLEVDLNSDVTITSGELTATGVDAVYYRRQFDNKDKRMEVLTTILSRNFPGASLIEANFEEVFDLEKPVKITFKLKGGGFIKQIGDKQALFPAGREIRMLSQYAPQASRDQELLLGMPAYSLSEKVSYKLPNGMTSDVIPKDISGESPFGAFHVTYKLDGEILMTEVNFVIKKTRISKNDYGKFRAWLKTLDQAINQPVVIKVNE